MARTTRNITNIADRLYAGRLSYALFALSGIVSALPFLFPNLFALCWVSFIPVFYPLCRYRISAKKAFLLGFARSYCFYVILYSWFIHLYPLAFLGMNNVESAAVIVIAMTIIPLIHSMGMSLSFLIAAMMKKNRALAACSLLLLTEYLHSLGRFGFPWARLSLSQSGFLPSLQSAEIFGGYFISFLILLVNALFAAALSGRKKAALFSVAAFSLFLLNTSYGFARQRFYPDGKNRANAVIVQGNIDSKMKWNADTIGQISRKYTDITRDALEETRRRGIDPDLVLYPETAIPVYLGSEHSPLSGNSALVRDLYAALARETGVTFFAGGFYRGEKGKEYNAVFMIGPSGEIGKPYKKRKLVPFGEYTPFRAVLNALFPSAARMNAFGEDLTRGEDAAVFDAPFGRVGALVCFDSIFDNLSRDSVKNGAQTLAIVTNDSWYKDSAAIHQHNAHAVLRAIENRRAVLRAANTGISSVILPTGEIPDLLPALTQGYLIADIPLEERLTPFTRMGNAPVLILSAAVFVFAGIGARPVLRRRDAESAESRDD